MDMDRKTTEIRLFISSTFEDMQAERECFNNRIIPRLQRMCRDKGISFFAVDLRWGITQEDIQNNQLVRLCLEEVDKCRPFFMGIIGNRYGSSMESPTESLLARYPWLKEKSGASYTELEITYHFLHSRQPQNMMFLFKQDTAPADPKVSRLKDFIREKAADQIWNYGDLAVFEETVIRQFGRWLDAMVGDTDVHLERERLYARDLLAQFVSNNAEKKSIEKCIQMSDSTVLIYGDGPLGKTALLNAIARDYPEKVVINCAADEDYGDLRYVIRSVYEKLAAAVPETEARWFRENGDLSTVQEGELVAHCRNMLENATCKQDTLLVINDLEFIFGIRTKYLQWIPAKTPTHFRIVCSSNHPDIINSAELMDWTLLEQRPMEARVAKELLNAELTRVGKNAKTAAPLLAGPLAGYPGFLKTAIDFLNCFGTYDTIGELSALLAKSETFSQFYQAVLDYIPQKYPQETARDLLLTLGAVALSPVALDEAGQYAVLHGINGASKLRWTAVTELISALRLMRTGNTISSALRNFLQEKLTAEETMQLHNALGEYRLSLSDRAAESYSLATLHQLRCALLHFAEAGNWEKILELFADINLLVQLCNFDTDRVRKGYATVLLCSERNVAKLLCNAMVEIHNKGLFATEPGKTAVLKLCGILIELQLHDRKERRQVLPLVDQAIEDSTARKAEPELAILAEETCEEIFSLAKKMGVQTALQKLDDRLQECETQQKKAMLLNIKADLLLKERHQGVLDNINEGLLQSIRAASVYNILFAYDLKAHELIRQQAYEEAGRLAQIGARWAEEQGYVFYIIAFANHQQVCLYRTKEYDRAIEQAKSCMALCRRMGAIHHETVFAKAIAMAYNLSGQYTQCIAFLEERLKNKNLPQESKTALSEVLRAACFNAQKYDKCCVVLTDLLKEKNLPPDKKMLLTASLATTLIMKEDAVSQRCAKLLEDTFRMAEKNGNPRLIHILMNQMYPYLDASKEGLQLWKKWRHATGGCAYFRELANPEELFANDTPLVSVRGSARVKANLSRLENDYCIAVERKACDSAAEAAERLARCHEGEDPVQAAQWYLRGAEVSAGEKKRQYLIRGTFAILQQGKARDETVLEALLAQMDAADKKTVALWQQVGTALAQQDDETALSGLRVLLTGPTDRELLHCCIGDLAIGISNMPVESFDVFYTLAQKGKIDPLLLSGMIYYGAEQAKIRYERFFGETAIKNASRTEPELVAMIRDSGYFTVAGAGVVPGQIVVEPRCVYKHLQHVSATLYFDAKSQILLGRTSIVFPLVTESLRDQLKDYVSKKTAPAACRITLQPNDEVMCQLLAKTTEHTMRMLCNNYGKFVVEAVRELDSLATQR